MNALMRHSQFDVHSYEAKPAVEEREASVGLSVNAQRALRLLEFRRMTKRAQAVKIECLQLIVVRITFMPTAPGLPKSLPVTQANVMLFDRHPL